MSEQFYHPLCTNGMINCEEAYDDAKWKGREAIELVKQLDKRLQELLEQNRKRNLKYGTKV